MANWFSDTATRVVAPDVSTVFSTEFIPKKVVGRDRQLQQIAECMKFNLNGGIIGCPGTGKSTAAKYMMNEYNLNVPEENRMLLIYIHAPSDFNTSRKIITELYKTVTNVPRITARTEVNVLIKAIHDAPVKPYLILDEYEHLSMAEFSNLVKVLTACKIKGLFITNNQKYVANIKPEISTRLGWQHITFPPYDKEEIAAIIKSRLKESKIPTLIDEKELDWLSGECASDGDARAAIQTLNTALIRAKNKNIDLTLTDLKIALKEQRKEAYEEMLEPLDIDQLILLYIAADGKGIKLQTAMYNMYLEACAHIFKRPPQSNVSIWRKLKMLIDTQYLSIPSEKQLGRGLGVRRHLQIHPDFGLHGKELQAKIDDIILSIEIDKASSIKTIPSSIPSPPPTTS